MKSYSNERNINTLVNEDDETRINIKTIRNCTFTPVESNQVEKEQYVIGKELKELEVVKEKFKAMAKESEL